MKLKLVKRKLVRFQCFRCGGTGKIQGETCYYCQGKGYYEEECED